MQQHWCGWCVRSTTTHLLAWQRWELCLPALQTECKAKEEWHIHNNLSNNKKCMFGAESETFGSVVPRRLCHVGSEASSSTMLFLFHDLVLPKQRRSQSGALFFCDGVSIQWFLNNCVNCKRLGHKDFAKWCYIKFYAKWFFVLAFLINFQGICGKRGTINQSNVWVDPAPRIKTIKRTCLFLWFRTGKIICLCFVGIICILGS